MTNILLIIAIVLLIVAIILIFNFRPKEDTKAESEIRQLAERITELRASLTNIEQTLKEDFRLNREENSKISVENRKELMETLTRTVREFQDSFDKNVKSFNELQREKFAQLEEKQTKLVESTEKKLEEMRVTVDEKLQKTLNERLGQSFELVGKQLESVQKGLGEMQTLAQDVGGLKKVLGNVKMRGGIGEVQLGMLLEQILAPEQYAANVRTKPRGREVVEYAIKLPGRDDSNGPVWLPIDAKFPKDKYEALLEAYDSADTARIDLAQKDMETTIKRMARDIGEKYLEPPYTTDFGLMFLPFEGIFAEVVRKAALLEELQNTYKVIVVGPTTLAAILNSLQIGFRTLAIQKRSSEVWRILGAVKKEFERFGGMLEKAQGSIQTGLNHLDKVVGVRSRAIQSRLKNVEMLGDEEARLILPETVDTDYPEDEIQDGEEEKE